MTDVVKLNARLPAGERNGLDALGAQVTHHPTGHFVLIAICDVNELTTKVESGETTDTIAKLRIRRIEALGREDLDAGERLLRRALEHRTGQQTLPEAVEVEIVRAFRPEEADDIDAGDPDELGGRR